VTIVRGRPRARLRCAAAVAAAAALAQSLGHHVEEALPSFDRATLPRVYLLVVAAGVCCHLSVAAAARRAGCAGA
jgi:hypothetical protein